MESLINKKFGRLTVMSFYGKDKNNKRLWSCKCSCGSNKNVIAATSTLKSGHTKSCGCLQSEMASISNTKINKYDLSGEYGIGYTYKNEKFYFDLEDYDKIKDYCWYIDDDGYVITSNKCNRSRNIAMHRLILNCVDKEEIQAIDHINHRSFDNRKINLRKCSDSQNNMNHILRKDNSSGITGVYYDKRLHKWYSQIKVKDKKRITSRYFDNKEDAIIARREAEEKYFGEYSYNNSINKERNY